MFRHYSDVMVGAMASLFTNLTIGYSIVFIQAQIKENTKALRHWLCAGNSSVTDDFPAQRTSNGENVPILWRHHVKKLNKTENIEHIY